MKELKCPKCGSVFSVDEADYASILSQVRNAEFEADLHKRLEELKGRQEAEQKAKDALAREDFGRKIQSKDLEINNKEQEINRLKAKLQGFEDMKTLELSNALAAKELIISGLKSDISRSAADKENAILKARDEMKATIGEKEKEIADLRMMNTLAQSQSQLEKNAIKEEYEAKYGVKYNITFTFQDKATDTIAVDVENKPFRTETDSLLFRPAGHGALIYNLNKLQEEVVSIKNIDNVANERLLPETALWKKVLLGKALELRDTLHGYLRELDLVCNPIMGSRASSVIGVPGYDPFYEDMCATPEAVALCDDIEAFLKNVLCVEMPQADTPKARVKALREKLNRPVRVAGMVKNQGEPGGGPFVIAEKDGSTSLQVLESVQINMSDDHARNALASATHFNPVDIVCCLHDYKGESFDLLKYVDEDAGFISSKSYQGRELKALELPGLWNGAMSKWNTLFVEVPLDTFNPVKVVLDLLRPAHQN